MLKFKYKCKYKYNKNVCLFSLGVKCFSSDVNYYNNSLISNENGNVLTNDVDHSSIANLVTNSSPRLSDSSLNSMVHGNKEGLSELIKDETYLTSSWMKINEWNLQSAGVLKYLTFKDVQNNFNDTHLFDSFSNSNASASNECVDLIQNAYKNEDVLSKVAEAYNHSLKSLIAHAKNSLSDADLLMVKKCLVTATECGVNDFHNLMCIMNITTYGMFAVPFSHVCVSSITSKIYCLMIDTYPDIPRNFVDNNSHYLSNLSNSLTSSIGMISASLFTPFKYSVTLMLGAGTLYYTLGCVTPLIQLAIMASKSSAAKKISASAALTVMKSNSEPDNDAFAKLISWMFPS